MAWISTRKSESAQVLRIASAWTAVAVASAAIIGSVDRLSDAGAEHLYAVFSPASRINGIWVSGDETLRIDTRYGRIYAQLWRDRRHPQFMRSIRLIADPSQHFYQTGRYVDYDHSGVVVFRDGAHLETSSSDARRFDRL